MCLAIYKPAGIDLPVNHLENGFENHSDGAGMAWAADGKLHVRKGMFKIEEVLDQYAKVKQYPCLIHFRKATHGKVDAANCHPFLFNDGKLALIHNGVLNIKCSIDGLSDTAHFVKLVLEPMVNFHGLPINDGALNYLICTSIGSDKMAVMDGDGVTYIFNESKGEWENGVWYSNTSFKYSYKKVTAYNAVTAHPHFQGSNNPSFRKHWTEDDDGDDAYIDFWKRACSSQNTETDNLPAKVLDPKTTRLLGPPHHSEIFGKESVDDAGNVSVIDVEEVAANTRSAGQMCEYGWFDSEIEADVEQYQNTLGLSREEALLRIFNEKDKKKETV